MAVPLETKGEGGPCLCMLLKPSSLTDPTTPRQNPSPYSRLREAHVTVLCPGGEALGHGPHFQQQKLLRWWTCPRLCSPAHRTLEFRTVLRSLWVKLSCLSISNPNNQSTAFGQTHKPPRRFTCTRSHPCSPCTLNSSER